MADHGGTVRWSKGQAGIHSCTVDDGKCPPLPFGARGGGVLGNISCFACRSWARLGLFPEKFSSFLEAANLHCKNSGPHGISSACLGTWGRAVKSRAVSALLGAPSESIETPGASAVPSPCVGSPGNTAFFSSPPAGCSRVKKGAGGPAWRWREQGPSNPRPYP